MEESKMRKDSCKYFTSPIHNTECKKGINYRKLAGEPREGYLARIPCAGSSPLRKGNISCELKENYTKEEILAQETEMKIQSEMICKAINEIKKIKTQSGHIECPKCKNQLSFSVAKLNGHIWGRCKTEGCLAWMM